MWCRKVIPLQFCEIKPILIWAKNILTLTPKTFSQKNVSFFELGMFPLGKFVFIIPICATLWSVESQLVGGPSQTRPNYSYTENKMLKNTCVNINFYNFNGIRSSCRPLHLWRTTWKKLTCYQQSHQPRQLHGSRKEQGWKQNWIYD